MSDSSVRAALRSDAPLVLIEAPAGCGKTYQASAYARELAENAAIGRPLALTHTHAACSVLLDGTRGCARRLEIRTIDSVVASVAHAYHKGLGLPQDVGAWIRSQRSGYEKVASRVARLLLSHPMIAAALARRHPIIICDEHQDSSADQHSIVMCLLHQGASLRFFVDPMQQIFKTSAENPGCDWSDLKSRADMIEELDFPHRWVDGCPKLGEWILEARAALKSGGVIDLRGSLPESVQVLEARNTAPRAREFRTSGADMKLIDAFERNQSSLLVLSAHNDGARSFRSLFFRRIALWEGHMRPNLETLVTKMELAAGNPAAMAEGCAEFLRNIGKGLGSTALGNQLIKEAADGCTAIRSGKAAAIQGLARLLVSEPNHVGVAKLFRRLSQLIEGDPAFREMKVDCRRELWDGIHLGDFESVEIGLREITRRRAHCHPIPPNRAISTIHKAKGLQCDSVLVMPCDSGSFPNKPVSRCLLYVAISRARRRLMLVIPRDDPTPLLRV